MFAISLLNPRKNSNLWLLLEGWRHEFPTGGHSKKVVPSLKNSVSGLSAPNLPKMRDYQ